MPYSRDPESILDRVEWTVVRRLEGLLQGNYRTLFRGFGLDLAELREYQAHDDVRQIDWNVTARLNTPYIRQYNEDREVQAWFLLDVSPSLDFGSDARDKRGLLVDFVTAISRLLSRHGNRVGAALYGDGVGQIVPARGGRRHLLYLIDTLLRTPRLGPTRATDLTELLRAALVHIRRRSVVFLVSDFYSAPGWGPLLGQLAQKHDVTAVRIFDPLEVELPDAGLLTMADPETGEQLLVDTSQRGFRRRYAAAVQHHEQTLRSALTEAGVDGLELSTADDLVDAILRYTQLRNRQRQAGAVPVAAGQS